MLKIRLAVSEGAYWRVVRGGVSKAVGGRDAVVGRYVKMKEIQRTGGCSKQ